MLNWLAPVGQDLIRSAALEDGSNVLDVAAGTGEPGLTAATLVPRGWSLSRIFLIGCLRSLQKTLGVVG